MVLAVCGATHYHCYQQLLKFNLGNISVNGTSFKNNSANNGMIGAQCIFPATNAYVRTPHQHKHTQKQHTESNSTGGGIYSSGNSTLTLCVFTSNTAQNDGGAVFSGKNYSNANIITSQITKNSAKRNGGGK